MRLRPLKIALVAAWWVGLSIGAIGAGAPTCERSDSIASKIGAPVTAGRTDTATIAPGNSNSAETNPDPAVWPRPTPASEKQGAYLGVMGEAARPGVYRAPTGLRLADFIRLAGGMTTDASGSIRIFRGNRLALQVFLPSGSSLPLFAGDLVVLERRAASRTGTGSAAAKSPEVQIAFLNVIDRPIVVKMTGDQATVGRIVKLFGRPDEFAAKVRVIAPSGIASRDSGSMAARMRPLESRTVLIFPARSIRAESLPAFPEPIVETAAPEASALRAGPSRERIEFPSHPEEVTAKAVPAAVAAGRGAANMASLPSPTSDSECSMMTWPGKPHPPAGSQARAAFPWAANRSQRRSPRPRVTAQAAAVSVERTNSQGGPLRAILLVMSGLAMLAMLTTIASIIRRTVGPAKLWRRGRSRRNASQANSSHGLVPPLPSGVAGVGRLLRIDAGQPLTRLGIDLAVVERSTSGSRKSASIPLPEPSDRRMTA